MNGIEIKALKGQRKKNIELKKGKRNKIRVAVGMLHIY